MKKRGSLGSPTSPSTQDKGDQNWWQAKRKSKDMLDGVNRKLRLL
jgi:hypothetical protein